MRLLLRQGRKKTIFFFFFKLNSFYIEGSVVSGASGETTAGRSWGSNLPFFPAPDHLIKHRLILICRWQALDLAYRRFIIFINESLGLLVWERGDVANALDPKPFGWNFLTWYILSESGSGSDFSDILVIIFTEKWSNSSIFVNIS
jgi:hypothetical protein